MSNPTLEFSEALDLMYRAAGESLGSQPRLREQLAVRNALASAARRMGAARGLSSIEVEREARDLLRRRLLAAPVHPEAAEAFLAPLGGEPDGALDLLLMDGVQLRRGASRVARRDGQSDHIEAAVSQAMRQFGMRPMGPFGPDGDDD